MNQENWLQIFQILVILLMLSINTSAHTFLMSCSLIKVLCWYSLLYHINSLVLSRWSLFCLFIQHTLANTVMVPKRAYQRLNRSRMSIFTQELAVLVFTKETLSDSTLTGKSSKGAPLRRQLDVEKVQAITGNHTYLSS